MLGYRDLYREIKLRPGQIMNWEHTLMYENVNKSDVHQTLGLDRKVLSKRKKEKHDETKHSLLEQ